MMRVRPPLRFRWAALAALLLVAAAIGWYLSSPLYTLNRMAAVVEARDMDALSAYIDHEAFRQDATAELMQDLLGPLDAADAGGGEFGNLLADAMIGPTVEDMISQKGLERAFGHGADAQRATPTPAPGPGPVLSLSGKVTIDRKGPSTFLAASENRPQVKSEFRRSWLSWKLSGIELDEEQR